MLNGKLVLWIDSDILWFAPQFSAYVPGVDLIIVSVKLSINSRANG